MNRGLIVGKVFKADGKGADGAYVYVSRVYGGNGLIGIKKVAAYAESDGKYAVPFVWDGWSGFTGDLSVISIEIAALSETTYNSVTADGRRVTNTVVTASSKGTIRGVLRRDIISLTGVATSNFDSPAEVADFGIDIGKTLAGWDKLVPFWKAQQLASSENWLILGGAILYLK